MSANPVWIAGYFGPVAGAAPVWIAPGDGTIPSAVQSEIVSYYAPVAGATAVWIAGFFAPPPAAIGATPITIGGWGGSGGGGPPPVTSVWSADDAAAGGMTLSNGGLTVTGSGAAGWGSIRSSISQTAGKLYVEFKVGVANPADAGHQMMLGLASSGFSVNNYLGSNNYSFGVVIDFGTLYASAGFSGIGSSLLSTGLAVNDVLMAAVDFGSGKVWLGINNVWSDGNPSAGTGPTQNFTLATVGALFPTIAFNGATGVVTLQSTAASQKYAPPSGFTAWG